MFQTFLKFLKQAASGLGMPHTSCEVAPGPALEDVCLVLQLDLS